MRRLPRRLARVHGAGEGERVARPHAEEPRLCSRLRSPPDLIRGSIILRKEFFRRRWIAGLRLGPRADGSHVRVAVFIVNNRPETMERIRPHVKVGSSHEQAAGRRAPVSRAQRSGALQTRDRYGPWRSRISGAPLHFVTRCTASGTRVTPVASLSHDVKQPYSTQRRTSRRLKSPHRRAARWGATATRPAR
jgi:hypothetical protein